MLQATRVQATNNHTINDLWITETRKHEVIQTAEVTQAAWVQGTDNLWEWLLSNTSKLRDFALAGAAGTYALGFIIWSIHALRNNLGLPPALNSQYIIAGLIPLILLGLAVAPAYVVMKRIQFSILAGGVVIFICVLIMNFFTIAVSFLNILPAEWLVIVGSLVGYVFMAVMFTMALGMRWGWRWRRWRWLPGSYTYLGYVSMLMLLIIVMGYYALAIFPNVPHSLGGVKPRCAYLDIDISKISADSRSALFRADRDTSTTKRSDALDVYYAGDNWVLVKEAPTERRDPNTAKKTPTTELEEPVTYEIDRDAINSIIWC